MVAIVIAAIAAVGMFFLFPRKASGSSSPGSARTFTGGLDDLIRQKAEHYSIPFSILKAVVWKESGFNTKARNDERKKGDPSDDALGLMQIRYGALSDYNDYFGSSYEMVELFDPAVNLEVGAWYLGRLIERNGLQTGVEMYNTGESGYLRGVRSTQYVASIVKQSQTYMSPQS